MWRYIWGSVEDRLHRSIGWLMDWESTREAENQGGGKELSLVALFYLWTFWARVTHFLRDLSIRSSLCFWCRSKAYSKAFLPLSFPALAHLIWRYSCFTTITTTSLWWYCFFGWPSSVCVCVSLADQVEKSHTICLPHTHTHSNFVLEEKRRLWVPITVWA